MEYFFHILILTGIYIILTLSLNLLIGFTGIPSLGHASFSCIGAYASSLISLHYGMSPWISLGIGACIASFSSILIGYPALRLKNDYLALATFGMGIIVYSIAKNWISLTRGPFGISGIPQFMFFGYTLSAKWAYSIVVCIFTLTSIYIINRIVNSPFGRVLKSIREDEIAAQALGKNIVRYKLTVFVISAFFAGLSGGLYAHYITFIDPSSFTIMESVIVLLMVIFGGLGSIVGSICGAAFLVLLPEALRFLNISDAVSGPLRQMIFGALLIFLMLKRPQGLMGKYRFL
jgi:branched-chain amino acid transport system permease protein